MSKEKSFYGKKDADLFVEYLGCWKYPNPYEMKARQSDEEYKTLLHQLIRVNESRKDRIAQLEIEAAQTALKRQEADR